MFEASRLKIRRAGHHVRELKAALETYCKSSFCRIGVDAATKDGAPAVRMERTRELPGEIPLMLGDAIHNLRSSLDLMACALVRSGGRQPTRFTRFPIELSREKFVATLDGGAIKAARPDLADFLVDTIRPYKGGDDALSNLNDLDLDERHKLIVPDIAVVALHNVAVKSEARGASKIGKLEIGPHGVFRVDEALGRVEITSYQDASFQALFDATSAYAGQPIVPTLHLLAQQVAGVVDSIQQAAEAAKKGG